MAGFGYVLTMMFLFLVIVFVKYVGMVIAILPIGMVCPFTHDFEFLMWYCPLRLGTAMGLNDEGIRQ